MRTHSIILAVLGMFLIASSIQAQEVWRECTELEYKYAIVNVEMQSRMNAIIQGVEDNNPDEPTEESITAVARFIEEQYQLLVELPLCREITSLVLQGLSTFYNNYVSQLYEFYHPDGEELEPRTMVGGIAE